MAADAEAKSGKMRYVPKNNLHDLEQQKARDEAFRSEKEKQARKKGRVIAIAGVLVLVIGGLAVYAVTLPGEYDDFAKCLTEKGAMMYGEDWCKYTNAQKNMFGKSFKYVNYQVKTGLKLRPTWIIDGNTYETVQTFERLSSLTGCKY